MKKALTYISVGTFSVFFLLPVNIAMAQAPAPTQSGSGATVGGTTDAVLSNPLTSFIPGPIGATASTYQAAKSLKSGVGKAVEGVAGDTLIALQTWWLHTVNPFIANAILWITSWILWACVAIFNITLNYSLNFGAFLKQINIIETGWKIFRDVANICFIFILLYIAISTIIQSSTANTQKLLVRLVVIALLLNFSLFFARVVVDTGNILALSIYQKMGATTNSGGALPVTGDPLADAVSGADQGISSAMIRGLGLTTIYERPKALDNDPNANAKALVGNAVEGLNILVIAIGGAIFMLVTAFVFIVAAILFLIRTVTLVFLMILSPLAFAANILPQTQKHFASWSSMLINQSFFPAVFLLVMLLVFQIITKQEWINGHQMNFAEVLTGQPNAIGTLFTFVILIGLMLGSLIVSKQMGAHGGDMARNAAGKLAFGAGAYLTRQTLGRAAAKYTTSDQGKLDKDGNFLQRTKYNLVNRGATGTWDVRNTGLGSFGGGLGKVDGAGGAAKYLETEKKRAADLKNTQTEVQKKATLEGKKSALKGVIANPASTDAEYESATHALTEAEYAQLDNDILSNERVIRNSRSSQILAVLDDKNTNITPAQKDHIRMLRNMPLEAALAPSDDSGSAASVDQLITRFQGLSADDRDKIGRDSTHAAAWAPIHASLSAGDHGATATHMANLRATNPAAFQKLLSTTHHKNIQTQLGKLGVKEKAQLELNRIITNPDLLQNLDEKSYKAIMDRDDLSPTEKNRLKDARDNLIVTNIADPALGIATTNTDMIKEVMKRMSAEDVAKFTNRLSDNQLRNLEFIKALKMSHMKEMENYTDEAKRRIIGNTIRMSPTGSEKDAYVKLPTGPGDSGGKGHTRW